MSLLETNHFNGFKGCPNWNEMYMIFSNSYFPKDDEGLVVYQNIKKSELHSIATRPNIMPYNDIVQWVFSHLETNTPTIMNEERNPIASLNPYDTHMMYQLPTPKAYLKK